MAGLTRKFIKDAAKDAGVEIPNEMIDAIIDAHVESRDAAIAKAVEPLNEQIETANTAPASDEFKTKYETLLTEHEALKTEIATKETNAKKQAAIRALVAEIGIGEKRHDLVLKSLAPDLDKIELDKDGKLKDPDTLKTSISTDWAEFIETTEKKAAFTPTPLSTTGGGSVTAEKFATMSIRERTALKQKDPKTYEALTKRS